jgi:hypothetical protein
VKYSIGSLENSLHSTSWYFTKTLPPASPRLHCFEFRKPAYLGTTGFPVKEEIQMKRSFKGLMCALGALTLALLFGPKANAACGVPSLPTAHPSAWYPQDGRAQLKLAAFDDHDEDGDGASIVGMWHVTFVAQTVNGSSIPDPGMQIDNALVVWHGDHTEIMNSMRPPQDGNFCLGVWERTGPRNYQLNHFAWFANQFPNGTNNGIGDPVGPTHFVEQVTLSPDGKHYTGSFTLTAYDTSGNQVLSFTGVITGERINMTTTVGDLL